VSINGATGILLNITGGPDLTLAEMNEACSLIVEAADPDANVIFGSVIDAHAGDTVRITVIATGFSGQMQDQPMPNVGGRTHGHNQHGHGHPRTRADQMALPMQPNLGAMGIAPTATMPATATARGGYAVAAQVSGAQQRRVMTVLEGGRLAS
jgi:hypothetical protein